MTAPRAAGPPELRAAGLALVLVALGPALVVAVEALAAVGGGSVVPGLERALGPICHHLPERTIGVMPVCARCSGLWVGAALAGVVGLGLPLRARVVGPAVGAALVGLLIGLVAAGLEAAGAIGTSNGVRVVLGGMLGAPLPLVAAIGGRVVARA